MANDDLSDSSSVSNTAFSSNDTASNGENGSGTDLALYVHIPFCVKRCNYCDFCSSTNVAAIEDYFKALHNHIKSGAWIDSSLRLRSVSSIYFGGGTPSFVHTHLISVLATIRETFNVSDDCEITLEANPESFWIKPAMELAAAGFTRVSLGVQSLDDAQLALLGRLHNVERAFHALQAGKDAGLRVSADLMLGLPVDGANTDASVDGADASVDGADDIGNNEDSGSSDNSSDADFFQSADFEKLLKLVEHISVYPLTVEEGTELQKMEDAGEVTLPSEDELAAEILRLEEALAGHGFKRYEISSYTRPGQESRQNLRYWQGGDYLGFGASASSMLNKPDGGRKRFVMYDSIEAFLDDSKGENENPAESDILSPEEALRESVMLALRTSRGAGSEEIESAGLTKICDELVEKELLEQDGAYYRCTQQGWLLANIVFAAVWFGNAPNAQSSC